MAYVVRAASRRPGEGAFHANKTTAPDALFTAMELLSQGATGVTIMIDDGQVFTTLEFSKYIVENSISQKPSTS
jgi:hypothetical protein